MTLDLRQKHSRDLLKKHIYELHLIDILKTQILDIKFIIDYILNKNYQLTESEKLINIDLVLCYQPHIVEEELLKALNLKRIRKMVLDETEDQDSVDDFETISKLK
jgi:hypothetical protein